MKKNIKLLVTSLLLFFIQFSCEKDKNYVEIASIQLDSSLIIEKAKEHFITSTRNLRADDERRYTPQWEFSEVITKQNGNNLVLTPLYGDKMVSYTNKPGYFRRLVTELDKKNAIKETKIIELFGEINFIKLNYKILLDDTNNKRLKEFKGGILVTDYYSKTENGKKYNLEKIIGKLNLKIKSKNKNARGFSEDCWGMFLTTTYEDGSQTEELLYWWCNNSGNQTNNQDQQGPDHGSSGGDPNDEMAACKPCIPVAGTWGYRYHSQANGNDPHNGMINHTHHYKVNQRRPTEASEPCRCFWNRDAIDPTDEFSPKLDAVALTEEHPSPSGGGLK